jgi:KUP system potassium uptake protein
MSLVRGKSKGTRGVTRVLVLLGIFGAALVTVETEAYSYIPREKRAEVHRIDDRFQQVGLRYGYMQNTDVPRALQGLAESGLELDPKTTFYFLGRESVIPSSKKGGMARWREKLFAFQTRNAWSAMSAFCLPPERSIEIRGHVLL